MNLIQAQRLVRRDLHQLQGRSAGRAGQDARRHRLPAGGGGTFKLCKGRGCGVCNGTGYKGRVGLYEVMEISEGIRDLIMVGATAVEIKRKALEEGMLTLRMSGLEKIKAGITTIEEVLRETVL